MDLQEPFQETGFQRMRRSFPWLHLLRVPGIAGRGRMLFAGFLFGVLLWCVDLRMQAVYGFHARQPSEIVLGTTPAFLMNLFFHSGWKTGPNHAMWDVFQFGWRKDIPIYYSLASLILHAICGLVLCRMAAGLFTTGHNIGFRESVRFSLRKFATLVGAMLFPLLMIGFCYAASRGLLMLGDWGGIGSYWQLVSQTLAFPWIFLCVTVLFGLIVGWPLLVSCLATENGDVFDVWSRSFDYFRSSLLSILLMFFLVMLLNSFVVMILAYLFQGAVLLAHSLMEYSPKQAAYLSDFAPGVRFWICFLDGYVLSLYWSAVTAIYVLARNGVDRVPLEEFRKS